jgi:anaerobic magnesium-protoporphyrin IX monomethyl ester cyclase
MRKIQIVIAAPNVGSAAYGVGALWSPGLLSLASSIKVAHPEVAVEMIDGTLEHSIETLERRLDPTCDLLGFSVETSNYVNSIRLATFVKARGAALVLFGGVHATSLGYEILSHRQCVDVIVRHRGELPLSLIIAGDDLRTIPGLIWRSKETIVTNALDERCFRPVAVVPYDYSLLEYERYLGCRTLFASEIAKRPYVTFTHEGCTWRHGASGGCIFCSIQQRSRYRSPVDVWQEFRTAERELRIEFIKDFGDDISANVGWLRRFAQARPRGFDIPLFVYVSTRNINSVEVIDILKDLNVTHVFIGFESGNDNMLRAMHKGTSVEQHLTAIKLLAKGGIGIYGSFVLGAPGESAKTLEDTRQFARMMKDLADVPYLSACPLVPFPGSGSYLELAARLPEKYWGQDFLDVEETMVDWAETFCPDLGNDRHSRFKLLRDYEAAINDLSTIHRSYYLDRPESDGRGLGA